MVWRVFSGWGVEFGLVVRWCGVVSGGGSATESLLFFYLLKVCLILFSFCYLSFISLFCACLNACAREEGLKKKNSGEIRPCF